jgi:DnaJ like chaperone protein
LGALVGGSLGFIVGGPIGAMIGGVLGAQITDPGPDTWRGRRLIGRCPVCSNTVSFKTDEDLICPGCGSHLSTSTAGRTAYGPAQGAARRTAQGTAQSAFMVALISLAAKVAKADGKVTQKEIAAFDRFLQNDLGMPSSERKVAARIFNQARDSQVPAADFARQLRAIMAGQRQRLRDLVTLLLKVAWADGRLSFDEESFIRTIATDLGLSPREYDECKALFSRGSLSAAYAVLEVDPVATDEEIKKSYRRLAREYHPDKLASKGLPEDFMKFATEKLQAINEAYDMIRQQRGF